MLCRVMENVDLPEAQEDLARQQFRIKWGHRRRIITTVVNESNSGSERSASCACRRRSFPQQPRCEKRQRSGGEAEKRPHLRLGQRRPSGEGRSGEEKRNGETDR